MLDNSITSRHRVIFSLNYIIYLFIFSFHLTELKYKLTFAYISCYRLKTFHQLTSGQ